MLVLLVLVNLLLCHAELKSSDDGSDGQGFISTLRNDANLDLSVDEEYEDLRAELLAYNTALATLTSSVEKQSRRSMTSTPCWELGGICVNYKLCVGFHSLTQVPGCKNKLNVCCFTWNKYKVSDWTHKGIANHAMPWSSSKQETKGLGIVPVLQEDKKKRKKKRPKKELTKNVLTQGLILEPAPETEAVEPEASVVVLLRDK